MGKIKTVVIFAAGYVVGARAGRRRYQQIKNWVQEIKNWVQAMWGKPVVQDQIDRAEEQVGKLAHEAMGHLPGFSSDTKAQACQDSAHLSKSSAPKDSGQASDGNPNTTAALDSEGPHKDPYTKHFGPKFGGTANNSEANDSGKDPYAKNFGCVSDANTTAAKTTKANPKTESDSAHKPNHG